MNLRLDAEPAFGSGRRPRRVRGSGTHWLLPGRGCGLRLGLLRSGRFVDEGAKGFIELGRRLTVRHDGSRLIDGRCHGRRGGNAIEDL